MKLAATAILACALASPAALCAPTTTPATTTTKPPVTTAAPTPAFTLGTPKWVGPGCPSGTASIVQSADGKNISLLFTAFRATTSATSVRERKDCNLTVPVIGKPHVKVGFSKEEYRFKINVPYFAGYVPEPGNTDYGVIFESALSWAGKPGPGGSLYYGPGGGVVGGSTGPTPTSEITWSRCGASTVFGVNAAVTAQNLVTNSTVAELNIAFDSADPSDKVGLFYSFVTKSC